MCTSRKSWFALVYEVLMVLGRDIMLRLVSQAENSSYACGTEKASKSYERGLFGLVVAGSVLPTVVLQL